MVGRGPECEIRPNSDLVSRQHCLIQVTEESALIRDLGSRNGTLVNGQLVTGEHKLSNGDTLQIGPLVLEVFLDGEPESVEKSVTDTTLLNQEETAMPPPGISETPVQAPAEEHPIYSI
jgi:pSer/pThr/pTyr-binding forkhead associated (FHA) protein